LSLASKLSGVFNIYFGSPCKKNIYSSKLEFLIAKKTLVYFRFVKGIVKVIAKKIIMYFCFAKGDSEKGSKKTLMYDLFAKVDGIAKSVRLKSVEHLSTIILSTQSHARKELSYKVE
jgi:hypothetical protein